MPDQPAPRQPSARSPFAGCTILICALCMMVFLIGFSVYVLFRQATEIEKFTTTTAKPVPVASLEDNEAAATRLTTRLEAFRNDLEANPDKESSLTVTADDINLAIASFEAAQDLRGTFHVREIHDGKLVADISFRLNGRPRRTRPDEAGLVTADPRYLNGTLVAKPELTKGEVFLRLESLDIPGATVPQPFFDQLSVYRLCERYTKDPAIGPAMKQLTSLQCDADTLTLRHRPGELAPASVSNAQVDAAGGRLFRFLGFAVCAFLVVAGLIVYAGLRRKARAAAENPPPEN